MFVNEDSCKGEFSLTGLCLCACSFFFRAWRSARFSSFLRGSYSRPRLTGASLQSRRRGRRRCRRGCPSASGRRDKAAKTRAGSPRRTMGSTACFLLPRARRRPRQRASHGRPAAPHYRRSPPRSAAQSRWLSAPRGYAYPLKLFSGLDAPGRV